jgi:hypothetical protein
MSGKPSDKEELYRRLDQTRRLAAGVYDDLTTGRLKALVQELERQIATAEARDADAPEQIRAV